MFCFFFLHASIYTFFLHSFVSPSTFFLYTLPSTQFPSLSQFNLLGFVYGSLPSFLPLRLIGQVLLLGLFYLQRVLTACPKSCVRCGVVNAYVACTCRRRITGKLTVDGHVRASHPACCAGRMSWILLNGGLVVKLARMLLLSMKQTPTWLIL